MRYYSVAVSGAPGNIFPVRYDDGAIWGTHVNGQSDPGSQSVEFHIEEYNPTLPTPDSTITIHGVSWEQVANSNQLMGKPIVIKGGLKPGLPLATLQSSKAGLLLDGQVLRAWGNWIGTDMSIGMSFLPSGAAKIPSQFGPGSSGDSSSDGGGGDASAGGQSLMSQRLRRYPLHRVGRRSLSERPFARGAIHWQGGDQPVITPFAGLGTVTEFGSAAIGLATTFTGGMASSLFGGGVNGLRAPINLIHNMMPNMPMSAAIQDTLSKAFPQANVNVAISSALKLGYQDAGMYQNMEQYAGFIQKLSQSILGIKNYVGVQMTSKSNTINVWDGTQPIGAGHIDFFDLIGQPTWLALNVIQVKCILRGDLTGGMEVDLPRTLATVTPDALIPLQVSNQRQNITISGKGLILNVRHVGDSRNPDGVGWSTTYDIIYPSSAYSGQTPPAIQSIITNQLQNPELPQTPFQ